LIFPGSESCASSGRCPSRAKEHVERIYYNARFKPFGWKATPLVPFLAGRNICN
jgi:hypothetical protein